MRHRLDRLWEGQSSLHRVGKQAERVGKPRVERLQPAPLSPFDVPHGRQVGEHPGEHELRRETESPQREQGADRKESDLDQHELGRPQLEIGARQLLGEGHASVEAPLAV